MKTDMHQTVTARETVDVTASWINAAHMAKAAAKAPTLPEL